MTTQAHPAPAIILTDGCFATPEGAVAHSLVRGSNRFAIRAVVDHTLAGRDAGEVLDGRPVGIPIVTGLAQALQLAPDVTTAVVGHAPQGGRVTTALRALLLQAAGVGLHLVNGLRDRLGDDAELAALASRHGATITDVRRTPPTHEPRFWDGSVHSVRAERIAVLGADRAIGKHTTARLLIAELNARGTSAEIIYTGPTGWMHGGRYGLIHDSTVSHFLAGELERAIVTCADEVDPDVMVIEGPSPMRNPARPCGAMLMLAGAVSGVVLMHAPARTHSDGRDPVASLAEEIALIGRHGVPVLAVALDLTGVARRDADRVITACRYQAGEVPIVTPFDRSRPNIGELADAVIRSTTGIAA